MITVLCYTQMQLFLPEPCYKLELCFQNLPSFETINSLNSAAVMDMVPASSLN